MFSGKRALTGKRFSFLNNFFDYTTVVLYPANFKLREALKSPIPLRLQTVFLTASLNHDLLFAKEKR
jgi:hypothetical protein